MTTRRFLSVQFSKRLKICFSILFWSIDCRIVGRVVRLVAALKRCQNSLYRSMLNNWWSALGFPYLSKPLSRRIVPRPNPSRVHCTVAAVWPLLTTRHGKTTVDPRTAVWWVGCVANCSFSSPFEDSWSRKSNPTKKKKFLMIIWKEKKNSLNAVEFMAE